MSSEHFVNFPLKLTGISFYLNVRLIFIVVKLLQNKIYEILNNGENFNETPSMRAIVKILRAQTSKHLSKFCEQIEQGLISLRAVEHFKGPFDTPSKGYLTVDG